MKKRMCFISMRFRKISLLSIFLLSLLLISCGNVQWFGDLQSDLEMDSKSDFRFYDFTEEELDDETEPTIKTLSFSFGKNVTEKEFPNDSFDDCKIGYHISGWKWYRIPDDDSISAIPDYISTDSSGLVSSFTVTPQFSDFVAQWAPNTDTEYKVQHWFQNLTLDGYDLDESMTQTLEGTTDTYTNASAAEIPGFTAKAFEQVNIEPDGSGVVNIYYDRRKVTVKLDDGINPITEMSGYYEQLIDISSVPDRRSEGFYISGWRFIYEDNSEEITDAEELVYPSMDALVKVIWKELPAKPQITVTMVSGNEDVPLGVTITKSGTDLQIYLSTSVTYSFYELWIDGVPKQSGYSEPTVAAPWTVSSLEYGCHSVMVVVMNSEGEYFSETYEVEISE